MWRANAFEFEPQNFATWEILTPYIFTQSNLWCWADSHWTLPEIYIYFYGTHSHSERTKLLHYRRLSSV